MNPVRIKFPSTNPPEASYILEVLGSSRQYLGDDEILGIDQGYGGTAEVHNPSPIEELVLEAGSGEHDVHGHSGREMDEWHHPGAAYEVGVIDPEGKTGCAHGGREPLWVFGGEPDGDVNVRAQSGHAVSNNRLGPENVPAPPARQDLRQVCEQFKGGGLNWHDGEAR